MTITGTVIEMPEATLDLVGLLVCLAQCPQTEFQAGLSQRPFLGELHPRSLSQTLSLQVSPELPSEMFPSSSQACGSTKNGCLPFGSYFSFSGTGDPENLQLPQGKPWGDSPYSGGFLQDAPPGVEALDVFTHPRGAQKPQKRRIPMKTRRSPKNTLVLGLEGILAVSSLTAPWNGAPKFITSFQDSCYQVSFKLRPHIREFLETLAKSYEVFVFTTAKQDYADKILAALGPHRKLIRHELYQEDCMCRYGSYVKDLSVLERDLGKTMAVATHQEAFPYQTSNVLVLPRWLGNPQDKELLSLIPVLEKLSQAVDVRAEIEMIMTK
ncbi:CTD small phosphatase-like protein 3 [Varanus komodoensis]|uniref:CTD small phosphatase-like protein 3 n=1 Tax=Varanus komodoensis TaxID=61221 RepID=UPI001CF7D4F9|nr:CTD small phosphatase-like protein 3 [Varanus komodoensis]